MQVGRNEADVLGTNLPPTPAAYPLGTVAQDSLITPRLISEDLVSRLDLFAMDPHQGARMLITHKAAIEDDSDYGRPSSPPWAAPGILKAVKPGRMQEPSRTGASEIRRGTPYGS